MRYVCESGVKFVTTSAGSPKKFLGPLQASGIKVYHAVATEAAAFKCADAGVDGLVIEGAEGGGFKNPEEVSTLVLLQRVREKVDIPLVAAGGICDGRGMAAAFALGAEAIQMGTRFVSSLESPVHANFKQAILDSKTDGTVMLNKKSSPCLRALKTETSQSFIEEGLMPLTVLKTVKDLYFRGDMEASIGLAGQSAGLIDEIKPVATIIKETIKEFHQICDRMGSLGQATAF